MKKKILVIGPSWVGDSVMAQPLYRRLHQRHPELELHVFAPSWTLPLLARMPEVAKSHLNPFGHGALRLMERWRVARQLAREGFDQVIVLPNSLKSALIPLFAGIPLRTGFLGESRYGFLNDSRELDEHELPMMVERFCALAEDKKRPLPRPIPNPRLSADPAVQKLVAQRLGLDVGRLIIAFCPGAEYGQAKRWPARHFAELARRFDAAGYAVWLFGSGKDKEIGEEISRLSQGCAVNLCGATGLEEAIDLIGLCSLAVCNDSGLMHVAAALDKPLVALYGSSSPDFTPPLSDQAAVVSLNLDCSPCFERSCPYGHTDCLEKMQPDMVWQAAQGLLSPPPNQIRD
ncbi:lipopolysaccharide heptosyltransferase II [Chromobacterium sphagni]|uniref:lipopolysaccharide heptosyltransferase II n=1 Tax=Chromobacterium sphagni TaxID=1903179 RepID=A0A1S1X6H1_9NEIS|nr:lipopolysaccharide heptosyltransferase II [Chromobacterium sphagni]OHX14786.1 lipopolysaccharide heptosyltransferase II [Chromobacterium sphagni]OHX17458.1 lipopolysaccharide heptosyltransferase II [Chromobacterium sphagni]